MYFSNEFLKDHIKIKGSLFKSYTYQVENLEQIKSYLNKLQIKYSDASHICYGYRIYDLRQVDLFFNPSIVEFGKDDGEPSGTAGRQIINVLKQKDIINRVVFIIRYFGGIKLGIPGLIEAYKGSSQLVLKKINLQKWIMFSNVKINLEYNQIAMLKRKLSKYDATILEIKYEECINIIIRIPSKNLSLWKKFLSEKSNGSIKFID